jgi:hypothetical protein
VSRLNYHFRKTPSGTSLPSTGRLNRLCPFACNRSFVVAGCFYRSRRGSTSQIGCVFGFFACSKATHQPSASKDGLGRTDTRQPYLDTLDGILPGSTSQIGCVFGFFACSKATQPSASKDGLGRTDTLILRKLPVFSNFKQLGFS